MSIAIIDYGVGNLFSLRSSLGFLGLESQVTARGEDLERASHIILPGVGAFGDAMDKLRRTGLIPALNAQVAAGKPLLGICLGMQMLFETSYEYGEHAGLGYLPGAVRPLAPVIPEKKVPHMGWNSLELVRPAHPLLANTRPGTSMYFVHSYYATDCGDSLLATAEYGVDVPAAVALGQVCGCQFHPEKSGSAGLALLRAFAAM